MGMFASGKWALGICDICGFEYKLKDLREVIERLKKTGLKACPTCWEEDHPQNLQGTFKVTDPQALRDPRPDAKNDRGMFGWNPVFVEGIEMMLGTVVVS